MASLKNQFNLTQDALEVLIKISFRENLSMRKVQAMTFMAKIRTALTMKMMFLSYLMFFVFMDLYHTM